MALYLHQYSVLSLFFLLAILIGVKSLTVALICISLTANDVAHLVFAGLFAICTFSFYREKMSLHIFCPFSNCAVSHAESGEFFIYSGY